MPHHGCPHVANRRLSDMLTARQAPPVSARARFPGAAPPGPYPWLWADHSVMRWSRWTLMPQPDPMRSQPNYALTKEGTPTPIPERCHGRLDRPHAYPTKDRLSGRTPTPPTSVETPRSRSPGLPYSPNSVPVPDADARSAFSPVPTIQRSRLTHQIRLGNPVQQIHRQRLQVAL
jgi:hypothetical protein